MKKILIIEKIKGYLAREQSILSRSNLQILNALSAEEALHIHKTENVNLIVAETDISGIDQLCAQIRRDDSLKHVSIFLVGKEDPGDSGHLEHCLANAFIRKPVNIEEFQTKVGELLNIQKRKDYRVLLKLTVMGTVRKQSFFCTTKDLSSSGILIETDKVLEKGDIISCSFFLPNSRRVIAEAEVVRTVSHAGVAMNYGARFINLGGDAKSAIDEFIRKSARPK